MPDKGQVEAIIGKDPSLEDMTTENGIIKTIAHRGAGLDAPENSLIAFKMCNDKGVNFIEFDITLTKDNIPVLFHDDTLERMTDCCDLIRDKTYDELKQLDISVKHSFKDRYQGTTIPTLDETVKQLIDSDQNMFIDIKDNNMQMVKVVLDLYEKYPSLYIRAITTSFFPNIIYLIRRKNPKIVCSLAWRPYAFSHVSYSYAAGKGPRRSTVFYKHIFNVICDKVHEFLLSTITYYLMGISFILLHKDAICGNTSLLRQFPLYTQFGIDKLSCAEYIKAVTNSMLILRSVKR
ncbi:Glycerophosphoryl diester phosphodiesterase family [Popillia japonica]|uniref:Glycerophosphoryl diester phosphodiesterase family n=1 Tax=Popillia japonica TaxID=7064 RepID=A0AAW1K320_POPJA